MESKRESKNARRRRQRKERWFNLGVEAFHRAFRRTDGQPIPPVYVCPLCIRDFATPDRLTFEDVPPDSDGKRELLLTCRECNSTAGHQIDNHLQKQREESKGPFRVRLTAFGATVNAIAKVSVEDREVSIQIPETQNHPRANRGVREGLELAHASGSLDWDINLQFRMHNPTRASIGWLKAGYLYAFAALGYTFALRNCLDPIRQAIQSPATAELPPGIVRHSAEPKTFPFGKYGLIFVHDPPEMRSIAVILENWQIFLPGFEDTDTFYQRFAEHANRERYTMKGHAASIDEEQGKQPRFAFDLVPSLFHRWAVKTENAGDASPSAPSDSSQVSGP